MHPLWPDGWAVSHENGYFYLFTYETTPTACLSTMAWLWMGSIQWEWLFSLIYIWSNSHCIRIKIQEHLNNWIIIIKYLSVPFSVPPVSFVASIPPVGSTGSGCGSVIAMAMISISRLSLRDPCCISLAMVDCRLRRVSKFRAWWAWSWNVVLSGIQKKINFITYSNKKQQQQTNKKTLVANSLSKKPIHNKLLLLIFIWPTCTYYYLKTIVMPSSMISRKSVALTVRYSQKMECISFVFYYFENISIPITLEPLVRFRWGYQQNAPLLMRTSIN